jgi:hypothetical protein
MTNRRRDNGINTKRLTDRRTKRERERADAHTFLGW